VDQTQAVLSAINGYFDLMYDADDELFPTVFHPSSLIHGIRDGSLVVWSAAEFRELMRNRPSPAAMNSPRDQGILNIELPVSDLSAATVRVRIGQVCFVDQTPGGFTSQAGLVRERIAA
jgi:Putative lumazine-binding